MSKRRKNPEHANQERWLVSYADFITLLFAFFVVMYALSMQNLAKVKAAAESIRKAFGGPALVAGAGAGMRTSDLRGETRLNPFDGPEDPTGELHRMKGELEQAAALETGAAAAGPGEEAERLQTTLESRGLVIRLSAKDFFAAGEAIVRPDLQPLLDRIGRVLAKTARPMRIEGYADPSEASVTLAFASDWELSAARAGWVARYWIRRFELDPARIGITGYSHYRPLPSDDGPHESSPGAKPRTSAWERGKNRRIEIVLLDK